ncbi:hypothetical protein JCM14076_16030 [Methylosoma difficile]
MKILAIVLSLIVVLVWITVRSKKSDDGEWPFYAKKPLSKVEQVLYFRLVDALPDYVVLAQVQMSRFLGVKKGNDFGKWFNRINRMSVDYLVCRKDFSIVAVIELDDKSHETVKRKEADSRKNKAIEAAGLKLIRWKTTGIPDIGQIKEQVYGSDYKIIKINIL